MNKKINVLKLPLLLYNKIRLKRKEDKIHEETNFNINKCSCNY